ncbi:MAG TPA: DNA ligase D [Candidatus Dormibacteraeota bacterium]|jgi:bifunctional non-homologous end joining protein LigD
MPLEEYRRKRDFSRTPEPRGGEGVAGAAAAGAGYPGWELLPIGRRFCVQMHRATRLHFDFRLEHRGVLLSWAVPKGPTLDPAQRRYAVHVEDHPIEYGDFEGVIPSGYGAGTVELWDAGAYEWLRETAEDPDASLRRGDLKFSLDGQKLHGEFALVRMGGRGGRRRGADLPEPTVEEDRDWLLIKKRDAFVVPGFDAIELDWSVKTGRSLAEIAAAVDGDTWDAAGLHPGRAAAPATRSLAEVLASTPERRLPTSLRPMLAMPVAEPFSRAGWLFEMKYDGVRALATLRDGGVHLRGRSGRDETGRYPELAALTGALRAREAVVDGEIVALDEEGRPSFERLQRRINVTGARQVALAAAEVPASFAAFDLVHLDGHDLRDLPLSLRKRLLRDLLTESAEVRYADHVEEDGEALFAAIRERGLEGMVAKRGDSRYEGGRRSAAWLKVKAWCEQDCVICGLTAGRGGRTGSVGSLVLGVYDGGVLVHAGQAGSGLDEAMIDLLRRRLEPLRTERSPFDPEPSIPQPVTWVRPELVCSVRFTEWTAAGTLRHPVFRGLRPDVRPEDCVRERALPLSAVAVEVADPAARARPDPDPDPGPDPRDEIEEALERLRGMGPDGAWEVGGRRLRLTNLDKVYWPEDGCTKRDMIEHYVRVAPVLLPHLRDRPVGMQVFPDGIHGKHFWRKRIPDHAPAWIRRWTWHGDREVTYVIAEEVATLAWMANSGAIDLHPWHSRIDAPEQPDWAVFDLDPFEPATFDDIREVARLVKAALDHLGLRGLPKTSGQTGLQIYVPLRRGPDYAAVRGWVEEVGRAIGQVLPDKISWEWSVARRTGRIRIDYTQNIIGKTLAAPYSLRPAPGAPVSTPITWEELDDPGLRPDGWNIRTIHARLAAVGDLFAPVLEGGQDLPGTPAPAGGG